MYGVEDMIPDVVMGPFVAVTGFFVLHLLFLFVATVGETPQGSMSDETWGYNIGYKLFHGFRFQVLAMAYIGICILLGVYGYLN
jgi:hypothetical protein